MKIDLPSGAWAELLSPAKLRAKHHQAVMRSITKMEGAREGALAVDLTEGCVAVVVQDWNVTYEKTNEETGEVTIERLPVPSEDITSIGELEIGDFETLANHPYVVEVFKKIAAIRGERVDPSDYDDAASPSEPSSGSVPGSRAAASPRTGTSGRSGTTRKSTSASQSAGAGRRKK